MTVLFSNPAFSLPFFLTATAPCPYLEGLRERKLFAQLTQDPDDNRQINSTLTQAGFRRSHTIVYRPACRSCTACVPLRIDIARARMTRSLRRVLRVNRDLSVHVTRPDPTDELFALFAAYQRARHAASDMAQMPRHAFDAMLTDGLCGTRLYQLKSQSTLIGAMIADPIENGLSAVYSFYRPDEPRRSLGTRLVLALMEACKDEALPYVYLGYWVSASRKMAYKARFPGLESLGSEGWSAFQDDSLAI